MSKKPGFPVVAGAINLQGTMLFPGCSVPLRLFEPRYVAMIEFALRRNDYHFCVGRLRGAETKVLSSSVNPIGTLGRIEFARLMPDGTYEVSVVGVSRVKFEGWIDDSSFPMARLGPLLPAENGPELTSVLERFRSFIKGATDHAENPISKTALKIFEDLSNPSHTVDRLSNLLVQDDAKRGLLLEELDVEERLRLLLHAANLPEI